jgi:hypothetical protein
MRLRNEDIIEARTADRTYPKGWVSCFADTFLVAESSVLRMKFLDKNPALRVAATRYAPARNSPKVSILFRPAQRLPC